MDFIKELGGSDRYCFHSHTEFCDGRAQMEAFAREVVARGFTHYGFSPHSPLRFYSPCNMSAANVPRYLAEVERIRGEYGDRCCFYAGMEIDFIDEHWGPASPYFQELPLDYRIGSVHFIPTKSGEVVDIDGSPERFCRNIETLFGGDIRYVVETFYAQNRRMIEAGGFDFIGHFDKIGMNASAYRPGIEEEPWYRSLVDSLVDLIIERRLAVEVNTKIYAKTAPADAVGHPAGAPAGTGRFFPAPRHLARLKAAGNTILVNSDAHVPALVDASRAEALSLLAGL
ncbi:MAG: histidinol-phosphatase [Alistipes timonensis]|nr:histidinol-phosphatase [Alistipes timonensis]